MSQKVCITSQLQMWLSCLQFALAQKLSGRRAKTGLLPLPVTSIELMGLATTRLWRFPVASATAQHPLECDPVFSHVAVSMALPSAAVSVGAPDTPALVGAPNIALAPAPMGAPLTAAPAPNCWGSALANLEILCHQHACLQSVEKGDIAQSVGQGEPFVIGCPGWVPRVQHNSWQGPCPKQH